MNCFVWKVQIFDCEERSRTRLWGWVAEIVFFLWRSRGVTLFITWKIVYLFAYLFFFSCLILSIEFIWEFFCAGVSQWMQRTVRNTLMYFGSNSALSTMPGFILFFVGRWSSYIINLIRNNSDTLFGKFLKIQVDHSK